MKIHTKKKARQRELFLLRKEGLINNARGQFIARRQADRNSMERDFQPTALRCT